MRVLMHVLLFSREAFHFRQLCLCSASLLGNAGWNGCFHFSFSPSWLFPAVPFILVKFSSMPSICLICAPVLFLIPFFTLHRPTYGLLFIWFLFWMICKPLAYAFFEPPYVFQIQLSVVLTISVIWAARKSFSLDFLCLPFVMFRQQVVMELAVNPCWLSEFCKDKNSSAGVLLWLLVCLWCYWCLVVTVTARLHVSMVPLHNASSYILLVCQCSQCLLNAHTVVNDGDA